MVFYVVERCSPLVVGCVDSTSQSLVYLITPIDIVVDNCAICKNHIMDLCTFHIFIEDCCF